MYSIRMWGKFYCRRLADRFSGTKIKILKVEKKYE